MVKYRKFLYNFPIIQTRHPKGKYYTMEKNNFLIFNDIVYDLYTCETTEDLSEKFLRRLKMLIPYTYASILFADRSPDAPNIYLPEPVCIPKSFTEAEMQYIRHADEDHLLWLIHGKESTLIRESDLMQDESRLNSPLYLRCYQKYNIYDTLQYSIVCQQQLLGILTLFRTRIDGAFSDDDMFFLRSFGIHLNIVLYRICVENTGRRSWSNTRTLQELCRQYQLTAREGEILGLLFEYKNNDEIAGMLSIRENTLQKHMQNIFRKLEVSSKWELLRFREN